MIDLIPISLIADFHYCPYSIYLHNVYMEADDSVYKAEHLYKGSLIHRPIDEKTANNRKDVLLAFPVFSNRLGLIGKIDMFNIKTGELIERKNKVDKIYPRHIYQLWAQLFCLVDMGYSVNQLSLYDYEANKKHNIDLPTIQDEDFFCSFLDKIRSYDPFLDEIEISTPKCSHCIYTNLCDKTDVDNVYT